MEYIYGVFSGVGAYMYMYDAARLFGARELSSLPQRVTASHLVKILEQNLLDEKPCRWLWETAELLRANSSLSFDTFSPGLLIVVTKPVQT